MQLNPLLNNLQEKSLGLFHLILDQQTIDKFKNIKYVILQGSTIRTTAFAKKLAALALGINPDLFEPVNLANTINFVIHRVGNVLAVSHGMGSISVDALLHSITKLLHYAGNDEFEYIRVGTSGGIGVALGSVIITQNAYMPNLLPHYTSYELDKQIELPTNFDTELIERILNIQPDNLPFKILRGNSIAADDFYLGQCRYDGAMPPRKDKSIQAEFFRKAHQLGIYNIEMESTALAAFCNQAKIPATMIAAIIINRLETDSFSVSSAQLDQYADNAQQVVLNYLLSKNNLE